MDSSPLSRVPAELRNRIYELALTEDKPVDITEDDKRPGFLEQFELTSRPLSIALTQTCRVIRQETSQMYYASTTFTFRTALMLRLLRSHQDWPVTIASIFLQRLEPNTAAAVQKVVLCAAPRQHMIWRINPYTGNDDEELALVNLKANLQNARKWTREIRLMAPECEVGVEVKFLGSSDGLHQHRLEVKFWFREDEVDWEKSLASVEENIAQMYEHVQLGLRDFPRWVKELIGKAREEDEA